MKLLFLDTETTGRNDEDRLCQVAFCLAVAEPKIRREILNHYFRPPLPVCYEAMAVHHITNEFLEREPLFSDSDTKKFLTDNKDAVLIAHNAPFDLAMLAKEDVKFPLYIDTLRVAMHLIESESYKLQYLRYSLNLKIEGKAHDAEGDVNVLISLYEHLVALVEQQLQSSDMEKIVNRMMALSVEPVLLKKFAFGKYFGQTYEDVIKKDYGYFNWLLGAESEKPTSQQNQDLIYTLKKYMYGKA